MMMRPTLALLLAGGATWAAAQRPHHRRRPPPGPPGSGTCVDTCLFASDGDCDDGGEGNEYSCVEEAVF